jgi:energy-converting hydrogenase B subunit D
LFESIVTIAILLFMIGTGIAALYVRDLLVSVALFGAFSFFAVSLYLALRSPDVAFTEAVIGVVSTIFFVSALEKTGRRCS